MLDFAMVVEWAMQKVVGKDGMRKLPTRPQPCRAAELIATDSAASLTPTLSQQHSSQRPVCMVHAV